MRGYNTQKHVAPSIVHCLCVEISPALDNYFLLLTAVEVFRLTLHLQSASRAAEDSPDDHTLLRIPDKISLSRGIFCKAIHGICIKPLKPLIFPPALLVGVCQVHCQVHTQPPSSRLFQPSLDRHNAAR